MKLLVDIGNSRVKWAFGTAGQFVAQGEALRDDGAGLRPLLESARVPDDIRIANVAGTEAGIRIAASLEERFRVAPVFACSAATGAGVRNGYTDAGQLGIDRWLAICAAFARYRAPVCVVDAGTATTIDIVAGSGEHQGGLILPGIALMQLALLRGTGDLARLFEATDGRVAGKLPDGFVPNRAAHPIVLGRDTAAAIRYGALQATASLIWTCMDGFSASSSLATTPAVLLITGGAAPALQAALLWTDRAPGAGPPPGFRLEYRPQLVLEGLALDPLCFGVVG
jgi:type III pantothenate kinase